MARQRVHQASFLRGELDPTIISRVDVAAYGQGLKKARNVIPLNQGGVERRGGTLFRADLGGPTRLESFIFNSTQEYIFAFQNTVLKIYSTAGALLATFTSCPWLTAELYELNFTQQGDTMIVVHENIVPQVITRIGSTSFTRTAFGFETSVNGEKTYQPYFKFADDSITLDIDSTTKGTTGVTCTTSSAYWISGYVGMVIRYHGAELTITGYTSSTVVTATLNDDVEIELDADPFATQQGSGVVKVTQVGHGFSTGASVTISGANDIFDEDGNGLATANINGTFSITVLDDDHWEFTAGGSDTALESVDGGGVRVVIVGHPPTRNWDEQVFSSVNGYPKTATFHEQRLYFGGVTALPDGIQGSKITDFYNFDVGKAGDADSIQIQIASDQINEIRHLVSGKLLQIFSSTSEFYLKPPIGKPITPTDIQIIRQSTLGSQLKAMPRIFDGATIYIQNNGKTVREYFYGATAEEFTSNSISLLSNHLISSPQDSAKITSMPSRTEQFYFLVNDDGTMGIFTSQRAEKIAGWMLWSTDGTIESIACTTSYIYISVKRTINSSDVYYLEQFASTAFDLPTDMTVTKTISATYQPHGTPLVNGAFSSTTTFIGDGFTNAPSQGETFQFAGAGTVYTIQSATATGNSGEYTIVLNASTSQSDGVALQFVTSKVFSGLNSAPDMRLKTVYLTSGSAEGSAVYYYGSGTVDANGVVSITTATSSADIGLNYDITLDTLPIDATIQNGQLTGYPRKIAKAVVELSSTYNMKVNTNDVILTDVTLNTSGGLTSFTGKKEVYFLGYNLEPNLEITQSAPLPMRLLGLTTEVYY
ncbi:MAG: hypothetical protein QGH26_02640 [Candidatus Pacebacteria bacterium]|nr:hypothetical protein [Candidatus Paceibacterota bacterium]